MNMKTNIRSLVIVGMTACLTLTSFGEYAAGLERRHCYGYANKPSGYAAAVSDTNPRGGIPPDVAATDQLTLTGAGGTMKGTLWSGEIYLSGITNTFTASVSGAFSLFIGGRSIFGRTATGTIRGWPAGWYPVEIRHNNGSLTSLTLSTDGSTAAPLEDDGTMNRFRHLKNPGDAPGADVKKAPAIECKPTGVVYMKASATGNGSGRSWENACRDLSAAIQKLDFAHGTNVIFIAAGVYAPMNQQLPNPGPDGIGLYGGFRGDETGTIAEMLAARDPDANVSQFSGTWSSGAKWIHRVPNIEADPETDNPFGYADTELEDPVVDSAGFFLPPPVYTGEHDTYYVKISPNIWTGGCLSIQPRNEAQIVDGITFYSTKAAAIGLASGAFKVVIRNCRFYGCADGIYINWSEPPFEPEIVDCVFKWGETESGQVRPYFNCSGVAVRNCAFESIVRSAGTSGGGNAITPYLGGVTVGGCTFARCQAFNDTNGANEQDGYIRGAAIGLSYGSEFYGSVTVADCVFSNCFAASSNTYGTVIAGLNNGRFDRCLFRDNLEVCRGIFGLGHVLVGAPGRAGALIHCRDCAFERNEIRGADTDGLSGDYALGIVGNGGRFAMMDAVGCTFVSNVASRAADAAGNWTLSAGLLSLSPSAADVTGLSVAHCTFLNDDFDDDVYDVAAIGAGQTVACPVINSVFDRPSPYQVAKSGVAGLLSLTDCTIAYSEDIPAGIAVSGLERDRVPLERVSLSGGRLFTLRPTAFMPSIRTTVDFSTNLYHHAVPNYRYRAHGTYDWTAMPACTVLDTENEAAPDRDVAGSLRAFCGATRGAVQALGGGAETGKTLVIRTYPEQGGTIGGAGPVQVVAEGGEMRSVTAVPPEGSEFLGWYAGDDLTGDPFSTSATLSGCELATRTTVLTAKFSSPKVDVTFDLGPAGLFRGNGQSNTVVKAEVGAAFPTPPDYAANEGWIVYGFGTLPSKVAGATVCRASYVSKALRIIYVVPKGEVPAGSDGTGEGGWQNATDDFAAAYANAGRYRGEVWMKGGRYVVASALTALANVTVRGGFAGNETSADAADPILHRTVITGDKSDNDAWSLSGGKIWNGTVYNEVTPDAGAGQVYQPANASDDTAEFLLCDDAATNMVFNGVDITCFGKRAFGLVTGSDLTLERTRLLACNSTLYNDYAVAVPGGRLVATNCLFHGISKAFGFTSTGSESNDFVNCRFANLSGQALDFSAKGKLLISGCTIDHNWSGGSIFGISGSGALHACLIDRCHFTDNGLGNEGTACLYFGEDNAAPEVVVRNCVFRGNHRAGIAYKYYRAVSLSVSSWANVLLEGCLFDGNSVDGAVTTYWWISPPASEQPYQVGDVMLGYWAKLRIVNSRLGGFVVSNTTAHCTASELVLDTPQEHNRFTLVHSVLEAPVLMSETVSNVVAVDMRNASIKSSFSWIDSIVDGRGKTTLMMPADGFYAAVANSLFTELDVAKFKPLDQDSYFTNVTVSATVPYLATTAVDPEDADRWMPMLRGDSSAAKAARPVYRSGNGTLYIYDPGSNASRPWINVKERTANSRASSVAGLEAGVTPPIADAFGVARRMNRNPLGPVKTAPVGFMLILK